MRTKNFSVLFILAIFSICTFAAQTSSPLPPEMLYKGQPIDALCFDPIETANSTISLKTCGIQAEPQETKLPANQKMLDEGYVGYEYEWHDNEGTAQSHGYSYYKTFPAGKNTFLVYSISSGGGSGQFSSLILAKRNGDKLELRSFAGGDRCNNGIFNVQQKNKILQYSINLTPFDYLDITKKNPHNFQAYEDLAACATCCAGFANLEINLQESTLNEKLVSVDLGDDDELTQGKHQVCFNKITKDIRKTRGHVLAIEELNALVNKFNENCM